ncbi:MAG: UDP-N-acetylmuramoyl-L-alanyl-D-glutamate--2,6-diaminopimelate ligase [Oligoflexales bacterium]|nr:UDP-N-acetylmuramoyl-L-alanyl-D-glutamate--2,6-diaminopimelate ligase [Oligoflexales bacterium]
MTNPNEELSCNLKHAFELLRDKNCLKKQQEDLWTKNLHGQGKILCDSRLVETGDIFIAYKGLTTDSHRFIPEIIKKKPGLIIAEEKPTSEASSLESPVLLVENSRKAWSYLCALACGNPQDKMRPVAITGTNGKTSTLWILKSLLEAEHVPTATIGTLGIFIDGMQFPSSHTTPDPPLLYLSLKKAVEKGVKVLAMEASSHSIAQEKLAPISYSCIAWTSFSQDHLDFHKTMDAYWQTKWSVFAKNLANGGRAILNTGITPFPCYKNLPTSDVVTYGQTQGDEYTDLALTEVKTGKDGSSIRLHYKGTNYQFRIPYWGRHNIENFICALAIFEKLMNKMPSPQSTASLSFVPGRLQRVPTTKNKPHVFIDYAHTPDALEKALGALRPDCSGKIYLVFGCGGERDQDKRPKMGAIAEAMADTVVITSDNPRSEDPEEILNDIKSGFLKTQPVMIEDRKSAITWAIKHAQNDDFVLVAGKGHESYQIIGSQVHEFDDYKVAKTALEAEK